MARYTGPKTKISRRFGEPIYGPDKYLDRRNFPPGMHGPKRRKKATDYGFDLHVSGIPSLFYLRIANDESLMLHQEWIAECVRRGIFFTNHHNHFVNASLTDEDIAETVAVAEEAFAIVQARHA